MSEIFRDATHDHELKLLVFGGRDYTDRDRLGNVLDGLLRHHNIGLVIHGNAKGADYHAGEWANRNRISVCVFPANWDYEGSRAGPIRNSRMLKWGQPDLAVAFPGGTGTADMRKKVDAAGIRLIEGN